MRRIVVAVALCALAGCGGESVGPVTMTASPPRALVDRPVRVTIAGLGAGRTATLTARWRSVDGTLWGSRVAVRGDRHGRVVLRGLDGMRFIWAMRPLRGHPRFFLTPGGTSAIRLTLSGGDTTLARATLQRRAESPGVRLRRLHLRRDRLDGYYDAPATSSRHRGPAVLTIGGSEGGAPIDTAALLASYGYPTLALYYFHRPGLPKELKRVPLEYFARALRWLARRPGVDPRRVVIEGGSRGAEGALLIASTYPRLVHGAIAHVPSYEVAGACCQNRDFSVRTTDPAWTLHGRGVPLGRIIRVERISGPVLVTGAGQDQVWDSSFYAEQVDARLDDEHFRFRHRRLDFPGAGHVMPGSGSPGADTGHFGGSPRANAAAGDASWNATLRYLRALTPAPAASR
jgi:dienelactone hydrolase